MLTGRTGLRLPHMCCRRDRKFVLSYFCGDDTLAIFEPPQRNSGITGGKFLERMQAGPLLEG